MIRDAYRLLGDSIAEAIEPRASIRRFFSDWSGHRRSQHPLRSGYRIEGTRSSSRWPHPVDAGYLVTGNLNHFPEGAREGIDDLSQRAFLEVLMIRQ